MPLDLLFKFIESASLLKRPFLFEANELSELRFLFPTNYEATHGAIPPAGVGVTTGKPVWLAGKSVGRG